jgi:hypothetical protein
MLRVLTFDGGGQLELSATLLVQEIERQSPGFLKNTDMLAGTSSGGMFALMLASRPDPASVLPQALKFWRLFMMLSANSLANSALSLVGLSAFFNTQRLETFFSQPEVMGNKTLGELYKRVVIPSFRLDGTDSRTGARTWKPKIFHNTRPDDPDNNERAVDVALRTGALPVMYPIINGFVDGSVFANNPSVAALAQIIANERDKLAVIDPAAALHETSLSHVRLLSIGVGEQQDFIPARDANWGYLPWLFNPFNGLAMLKMFLSGDSLGYDFMADKILNPLHYFRLNPYFSRNRILPFAVDTHQIEASVADPKTQDWIRKAVVWLHECGWMQDESEPVAPGSRKSGGKAKE